MIAKPDYDAAATKALEILIARGMTETPILPLPILRDYPGVRVISFGELASASDLDRDDLIPMFGANQDAFLLNLHIPELDDVEYVVAYNMKLPYEVVWRGVARELGHVVLGHDGVTRTIEARMAEAMCFAHHLLTPRPVIHLLQEYGIPLTMNVFASTTCCSEECVEDMRTIPKTNVSPELNRIVRIQFEKGISEYARFYKASSRKDNSPIVDFGTYMEGYKE